MKCFISKNSESNKSFDIYIRELLKKNNIQPFDIYDYPIKHNIINILEERIKNSDFILAVIDNNSPSTFYEIGIAKGLGKPIFVILLKDLVLYPSFLHEFPYVKVDERNIDNIDFPLKQFTEKLPKQKKTKVKNYHNIENHELPDTWESDLKKIRTSGSASELERFVSYIFKRMNILSKEVGADAGVDLVLWLDETETFIGNTILVEFKFGKITNDILKNGEKQLSNYLLSTNNKVGLLLYLDREGKKFPMGNLIDPLVIRLDLDVFLSQIKSKKRLIDVILSCRNNMTHGAGN
jgi:nucleoside 2-deoxyribosyltransferase